MFDDCLLEKAREFSEFPNSTLRAGNFVVLFAMLLLFDILQTLAKDPLNNLAQILQVTAAIADLSLSLRI